MLKGLKLKELKKIWFNAYQLTLVSHSWSYGIAKDQRHIGEYAAISENTKY